MYNNNIYLLLYKKVYNNNIYLSLYNVLYNGNKYFHYTRRCIMTTNIFVIHESVYYVIRDDV